MRLSLQDAEEPTAGQEEKRLTEEPDLHAFSLPQAHRSCQKEVRYCPLRLHPAGFTPPEEK
jgi:hypothetical protein